MYVRSWDSGPCVLIREVSFIQTVLYREVALQSRTQTQTDGCYRDRLLRRQIGNTCVKDTIEAMSTFM